MIEESISIVGMDNERTKKSKLCYLQHIKLYMFKKKP